MAKTVWRGATLLAPVPPVMVSCGTMEKSNIITVAWCGILSSQPPKTYVSIRPERHSHGIITQTHELVINLTTSDILRECDYCGIRSGRDVDKFEKTKLTKAPSSLLSCPIIEQSPLSLECKVTDIIPSGTHDIFICEIVATDVDEELLDDEGKLHLERSGLVAYSHGQYFNLGKSLGNFGFSHAKGKVRRAKPNKPRRA